MKFNEHVSINLYEDDEEKNYLFNLIPTPWVTRVKLSIEVHSCNPLLVRNCQLKAIYVWISLEQSRSERMGYNTFISC